MTRNRILLILGAIILIGGGGYAAIRARSSTADGTSGFAFGGATELAQEVNDGDLVEAIIGNLSSRATATGQYLPQDEASLSLGISGEVTELLVREGQRVSKGDPLLRIEALALERAVINAEQNLIIQQANLDQLLEPAKAEDIASARASLASAEANLEDLSDGADDGDIAAQEAAIRSARASLSSAHAAYTSAAETTSESEIQAARTSLNAANTAVKAAQERLNAVMDGASQQELWTAESSLRSAESSVATAREALENLQEGPSQQAISNAESALRSAESSVASTRQNLADLQAGAGEAAIANAQISLSNAEQQQRAAQDAYDHAFTCYEQDGGSVHCPNEPLQESATVQLDNASQQLAAAQASLNDLLRGSDPDTISAAQNQLNAAIAQRDAAQAALNDLYKSVDPNSLTAAQNQLNAAIAQRDAAQANLNELRAGASSTAVADAQSSLSSAISQRDSAKSNLDRLLEGPDSSQLASASASIAASQANIASAEAQLENLLDGSSAAQFEQAKASVASAEAQLANLQRAASETSVAIAEAQVRQAEINLEEARDNLSKATLTAPFDGIVTDVSVTQGEVAGGVVMKLVNFETLAVLVDVDEIDLGELTVGQEATVTFDAYPNVELPATVDSIATTATTSAGSEIVTFEVRLAVDAPDDIDLRIGMTANANLVTAQRNDVLLVPNQAITVDRSRGTFTVNVVEGTGEDRSVSEIQIGTGLRDSNFTQVTDGLEEGQTLLVGDFSAPTFDFESGPPGGRGGD